MEFFIFPGQGKVGEFFFLVREFYDFAKHQGKSGSFEKQCSQYCSI